MLYIKSAGWKVTAVLIPLKGRVINWYIIYKISKQVCQTKLFIFLTLWTLSLKKNYMTVTSFTEYIAYLYSYLSSNPQHQSLWGNFLSNPAKTIPKLTACQLNLKLVVVGCTQLHSFILHVACVFNKAFWIPVNYQVTDLMLPDLWSNKPFSYSWNWTRTQMRLM